MYNKDHIDNEQEFIALQQKFYGEPSESIIAVPLKLAPIQPHEVLTELIAAPLNPHDLIPLKNGPPQIPGMTLPMPQFPKFMGSEGLAKVIAVGDDVKNVKIGDTVDLPSGTNAWAERMVFSAEGLSPLPKSHPIQLSFYRLNPIMAYVMLKEYTPLEDGSWIVQNGANSSIGQYVIQFAKRMGVKTINIVRRASLINELKELGADHVILDSPSVVEDINALEDVDEIKLGLDTVGGDGTNKIASVLSPRATLITYGSAVGDYNLKINRVLFFLKRLSLVNFYLGNWSQDAPEGKIDEIKQEIVEIITRGELKTKIDKIFLLENYLKAFEQAFNKASDGKVVFVGPGYKQS